MRLLRAGEQKFSARIGNGNDVQKHNNLFNNPRIFEVFD